MAAARARATLFAAAAAAAAAAANICGSNATIGAAVVAALNLTYPGLEAVAAAASRGDLGGACDALAAYYAASNTTWWQRVPPVTPGSGMAGGAVDAIVLNDTFYLSGDPWPLLLSAWRATGNAIYASYFNAMLVDWVTHLPCPDAGSAGAACVPLGVTPGAVCTWRDAPGAQSCKTGTMESPWRSLEMGIRMGGTWPLGFFGFQGAAEFTVDARALAVLAAGEHNAALAVDGGHPGRGTPNWEMTQWQGLVSSCVSFPELRNTTGLLALALAELNALLADGVYADGVETEQASGYGMGTAGDFFNTLTLLRLGGDAAPPAAFAARVEAMWAYGAFASDPAGCLPRNGDSDLCGNGYDAAAAEYFGRADWTYVHTNGAQGTPPATPDGPSTVFPWAGQVILRSGFDVDATWVWFDVGPYGSSGHAHRDKLSLVLHARDSMLLVDSGRFAYQGTDLSAQLHREYAATTGAHNTLTLDGRDQSAAPAVATAPIPNASVTLAPARDAAFGSMALYDGLAGTATHTRAVVYQRPPPGDTDGDWAVVVDVVTTDRPRAVQAAWHAHPNATGVAVDAATRVGVVGGVHGRTGRPTAAQACVAPAPAGAASAAWEAASVVTGRAASPGVPWQGWFSATYDDAWPAPTLVYNASVGAGTHVFAWLLVPTAARGPCAGTIAVLEARPGAVVVRVTPSGGAPVNVTVPVAV